jgi:hypothetical protein
VRTVEEERPEQTACYTDPRDDEDNDGKNEIHGGMSFVGIKNAGTSDSETVQKGTLCCRVYKNGTKYMLTARHPIVGGNCKYWDITDNSYAWGRLNQNEGYKRLGRISHAYQKFDAALLNRRFPGYDEFTYEITEELSGGIIGRVTGDGIDVLNSEPLGEVHKRGRATCATTGQIDTIRGDFRHCDSLVEEKGQIQTTATQQDTDSGGPVYVRREDGSNPDDLYLLHIATRQWKESGDALGSSANVMNSEENIRFGGTPFDP